jgi:hypothetical protein
LDWVDTDDTFRWRPAYFDFDRTFIYVETKDSEGIQFKEISVTLQPVFDGNLSRRSITREEFLKGHRHVIVRR